MSSNDDLEKKVDEDSGRYAIVGKIRIGKKSPASDFELLEKSGREVMFVDDFAYAILQHLSPRSVLMYKADDGSKHCYMAKVAGTDYSGRIIPNLYGIRTRSSVSPGLQLFDMFRRAGEFMNSRAGDSITYSQEGLATNVPREKINELLAKMTYDGNCVCSASELIAVGEMEELLPYISWMGVSQGGFDGSLLRKIKARGEVGIFAAREMAGLSSMKADDFVSSVVRKFGDRDAMWHILYDTISDSEKRVNVMRHYCEGTLGQLGKEYAEGMKWIQAVGSEEEIAKAKESINS